MTAHHKFLSSGQNRLVVRGVRLRSLAPFVNHDRASFSFSDIQAALSVDKRSSLKAIECMDRMGYLITSKRKPTKYTTTALTARLLTDDPVTAVARGEALQALSDAIQRVGQSDHESADCKVTEVCISGDVMDASIATLPYVNARITVAVGAGDLIGIAMRRIEKDLSRCEACLRFDITFDFL